MSNIFKDNIVMTTKELADYLKLNEKTIIKMAQNGKLPGVKIGNQWRFHIAAINGYLQNAIVKSSDEEIDAVIGLEVEIVPLSRLTSPNLINLEIRSKTVNEVLAELTKMAASEGLCSSQQLLLDELVKREDMLSTAVGNGVALPHPRHPSTDLFKEPRLIILRSKQGIDFTAPDSKLVHLFFMICAPNEAIHLRLLAKVAKLFHAQNILDKFMSIKTKEGIIQLLLEFERDSMFVSSRKA